jgi:hypothetical protein
MQSTFGGLSLISLAPDQQKNLDNALQSPDDKLKSSLFRTAHKPMPVYLSIRFRWVDYNYVSNADLKTILPVAAPIFCAASNATN